MVLEEVATPSSSKYLKKTFRIKGSSIIVTFLLATKSPNLFSKLEECFNTSSALALDKKQLIKLAKTLGENTQG